MMALMDEKGAHSRARERNDTFSGYFERPPAITYSKRVKPLPLRGTHFRRRDPYTIPPDSDDDEENSPKIKPSKPRARQPDPDDSPLSEDELEAVYGRNASPVQSAASSPNKTTSSGRTSVEKTLQGPSKKSVTERIGAGQGRRAKAASRPVKVFSPGHETSKPGPATSKPPHRVSRRKSSQSLAPERQSSSVSQRPRKRLPVPARRLPVNELVLVTSPAHGEVTLEPSSDQVVTSDPIKDSSYVGHSRNISPIDDDSNDGDRVTRPTPQALTSIRKRLKTPRFTHKSVAALRKKNGRHSQQRIGDGFELPELHVDHRPKMDRAFKDTKRMVLGFSALNILPGPLPEVKFEDISSVLKVEAGRSNDGQDVDFANEGNATESIERHPHLNRSGNHLNSRRVGFSDRVLEEMVTKQLSSISAPRRVYSISSDHSDSDQEDFEVTDEEDEEEDDAEEAEEEGNEPEHAYPPLKRVATPPSNQHARQNSTFWRRRSSPVTPAPINHGVSLDFRKPHALGQPPTPFGKRKLMEVDDAIHDEPERPVLQSFAPVNNTDEEMLDDVPPEYYPAPVPSPRARLHGPRSILRNPTPRYQDSDTRPEDTDANTRRNSMVMLDEESRYFTTAIDMLQQRQQATKPRVLKHRSSELRRSNYLNQAREVQVFDSETRVPETSPEPERPDYTNFTNLDVLKRSSDAVWTSSQSLPKAPRDLKTLTRSVSKEHGTTGIRRRPSLPFQSPTKVQRR